ncbi:MAG: hypothetical protein F6K30_11585 [Cyanothece sp. SIO2G6]|nr:hypothetical protein [Cyanothece sp. SIO2G6]
MIDDLSDAYLDLLVPWDLPTDLTLSDHEKAMVINALTQLLNTIQQQKIDAESMAQPDFASSIIFIEQAISKLGKGHQSTPDIPKEKIALKQSEITDYDRYFNIQHVESDTPAICIVRSLLFTYWQFLYLCQQNPNLDPNHVTQQTQGFEAIAHLLIRTFNLNNPEF